MYKQPEEPPIDFTILVPVYFNEGSLKKTYQIIMEEVVAKRPELSYEFIFVEDGSKDGSYRELLEIKATNPDHVTIVKFTRNFGQVSGIMAGYHFAKGKAIINISADLQDPPQIMVDMLDYHFKEGYQLVIGTRTAREESGYRKITSQIFYNLMKKMSFDNMPKGGFDFALVSYKVTHILKEQNESNAFWQGQLLWTGYPIKWIGYTRAKREIGISRWTFSKKLKYLLDGVLNYSYLPLRLMSTMGLTTAILGFIYAFMVMIQWALGGSPFKGWSPIMIVLLVVSGLQMIMLGIIGEYLWRNLDATRKRGGFVVEKID